MTDWLKRKGYHHPDPNPIPSSIFALDTGYLSHIHTPQKPNRVIPSTTALTTTTTTMAAHNSQVEPPGGTFTLLLFASASSYTADNTESLTLPAPTTLGTVFQTLEARYPGFLAKVLASAAVTLNLEYVDVAFPGPAEIEKKGDEVWERWKAELEGWAVVVAVGDEVGVIPPVSSG